MKNKQGAQKANQVLQGFISEERKRVLAPSADFAQRVASRVREAGFSQRSGRVRGVASIWEIVPAGARPVFALSLTFLLAFAVLDVALPIEPARGPIEAVVSADMEEHPEGFLFTSSDVPTSDEFLDIVKDDQ